MCSKAKRTAACVKFDWERHAHAKSARAAITPGMGFMNIYIYMCVCVCVCVNVCVFVSGVELYALFHNEHIKSSECDVTIRVRYK